MMRYFLKRRYGRTGMGLLIGLLWFVHLLTCGKRKEAEEEILARIGDGTISIREFVNRVELSPLPSSIDISKPEGRMQALELLVCEKLLASEAEKRDFGHDPLIQKKRAFLESATLNRELYMEEVRRKVRVSEKEMRDAFYKMQVKLSVSYLRSEDRNETERWKKALDGGITFSELFGELRDSQNTNTGTVEISWGDSDEILEEAAYGLCSGEISPVVQTAAGYYILHLNARTEPVMIPETAWIEKKRSVEKRIRRKKEAVRSGEFVADFMHDKEVVLKGQTFALLVSELEKQIDFDSERDEPSVRMFDEPELIPVRDQLFRYRDEPLVTFKGGYWTLGDFLEKMWLHEIPVQRASRSQFRNGLQEAIRIGVRDALLAEEAHHRGLEQRPAVKKELTMWMDHLLYLKLRSEWLGRNRSLKVLIDSLKAGTDIQIQESRLSRLDITDIPMIAVWNDFQRQLVVPLWADPED